MDKKKPPRAPRLQDRAQGVRSNNNIIDSAKVTRENDIEDTIGARNTCIKYKLRTMLINPSLVHKLEENEANKADAAQEGLEVRVLTQERGRGEHRHAEVNGHDDEFDPGAPWLW